MSPAHRFAELAPGVRKDVPTTEEILKQLQTYYFDVALSSSLAALPTLTAFAKKGDIMYGSDYPYAPVEVSASFARQLDAYTALSEDENAAINSTNALALSPRLARQERDEPLKTLNAA
jgi:6-methylsalicylate decarboxylase